MEKLRSYSGLFIIVPEKEESVSEITKSIAGIINENGGKVVQENVVGKKKLSYPIEKKSEGIYYEISFSIPPEKVSNIKRQFEINTNLLRTIIDRME